MSKAFRIIPRVAHYGPAPDDEALLFLPDLAANAGKIVCYAREGEHGEADLQFYYDKTSPPDNRAKELADWYIRNKCEGERVAIRQRFSIKTINWGVK